MRKVALIIDDEDLIRMMLVEFYKEAGFTTFEAENGLDGIDIYYREKPNIITLDLHMPVMDGFLFLEEVKIAENPKCDIIVLTGHGDDQDKRESKALGAALLFRKPFDHKDLIDKSIELIKRQE